MAAGLFELYHWAFSWQLESPLPKLHLQLLVFGFSALI